MIAGHLIIGTLLVVINIINFYVITTEQPIAIFKTKPILVAKMWKIILTDAMIRIQIFAVILIGIYNCVTTLTQEVASIY